MRMAFVALSFHLNTTQSSGFFIDVLKASFEDFHVVSDGDAWYEIPRLKPDVLIVWQKIFSPEELECFGVKNIVLIPMYDACPHSEEFWNRYKSFKILCFSKTMNGFLQALSFDTAYSQYFCPPAFDNVPESRRLNAFYWERSKLVNWNCIKTLIGKMPIDSLHYHTSGNIAKANPDRPSADDVGKYGITLSDWFDTQEEYSKILDECSLYFAPRESEGIGLSFIEALSRGICVIAPDAPTMNEYITSGEDGLLYDPHNPTPVSLNEINGIRERALSRAKLGYERWIESIPRIIDFIKKPMIGYAPKNHPWLYAMRRGRAAVRHLYKHMGAV
jgi:glycosyltransferase involved in cell wall biosynthesis